MRSSITALAIRRIWATSRIIYALHPRTLAELADSTSEQLPGPIFSYLPHTNPLIIFPEPIPTFYLANVRGEGDSVISASAATPLAAVDR